ncbi:hypothetical protein BHE90_006509 [Fusarium euwallaceae]|uniref:Uncharacterized protein n=1 Tax=Fusarium euwallaceae TaxID=1147111 RepID=A0A430LTG8_9HYPO|nr:hypothetical protein BHE90_006509 [Fusarium euwallaceae]
MAWKLQLCDGRANIGRSCEPYISALETCPVASVTPAKRLKAANQTATCAQKLSEFDGYHVAPISIDSRPNCDFSEFLPILNKTCFIGDSMCPNYTVPKDSPVTITTCKTEAAIQYVRCTIQKKPDEVESCVVETAVRVDWLPKLHTYTGARKCRKPSTWIWTQVGTILLHIAGVALSAFLSRNRPLRMVVKRPREGQMENRGGTEMHDMRPPHEPGIQNPYEYPPPVHPPYNPYINQLQPGYGQTAGLNHAMMQQKQPQTYQPVEMIEKRLWVLDATAALQVITKTLVTAYLTVYLLEKSGYQGDIVLQLVFFAIRPRTAVIDGLMGLSSRWSRDAVAALGFDLWLSFLGGGYIYTFYWKHITASTNPLAPVAQLKILSVGSMMMLAPSIFFILVSMLASCVVVMRASGCCGGKKNKSHILSGVLFWMFCCISITFVLAFLMFIAALEIIARSIMTVRKTKRNPESNELLQKLVWEPFWGRYISTTSSKFWVVYWLMLIMSVVSHVGSWIFFVSYLKLAGDLFCPTQSAEILCLWILFPLGIDAVFHLFRWWTRDTYEVV